MQQQQLAYQVNQWSKFSTDRTGRLSETSM